MVILETVGAIGVVMVAKIEVGGREELTAGKNIDGLVTVCEVLNVEEVVTEGITVGMEDTVEERCAGNTAPFLRGKERTGFSAVPTGWPMPGKRGTSEAAVHGGEAAVHGRDATETVAEEAARAAAELEADAAEATAWAAWKSAALCLFLASLAGPGFLLDLALGEKFLR